MNIYEYLCKEARRITNESLAEIRDKSYWDRTEIERRKIFTSMLGLSQYLDRSVEPVKPVVTGTLERKGT